MLGPLINALTPYLPGIMELPEAHGAFAWGLAKGRIHKYIKRVPKPGGGYRYYYSAAHGGTVAHAEHFVEGASFKDPEGHWHIKSKDGDTLHLRHDETGEERTMTHAQLAEHLTSLHGASIKQAREAATAALAEARGAGASKKQIARLEERAKRLGVDVLKESQRAAFSEHKRTTGEFHPWDPAERTPPSYESDVDRQLASAAHSGTSHTPELRAKQEAQDYSNHMMQFRNRLSKLETPENKEQIEQAFQHYRETYRNKNAARLAAKSRVLSWMVTGPANFPNARNQKRSDAADNRTAELVEWAESARAAIIRKFTSGGPISSDMPDAPKAIQSELDAAKAKQAMMVAANKIYRNGSLSDAEKVDKLVALGVHPKIAAAQLKPDFAGRIGFPDYALTNNNAKIKRLSERSASVEAERGTATTEHEFNGGRVVDDADSNRVRIYHDAKPSADKIADLKRAGFKWSPSEGAWQRQRTDAARSAAQALTGAPVLSGRADKPVAAPIEPPRQERKAPVDAAVKRYGIERVASGKIRPARMELEHNAWRALHGPNSFDHRGIMGGVPYVMIGGAPTKLGDATDEQLMQLISRGGA